MDSTIYKRIIDNLDEAKIISLLTQLGAKTYINKDNYIAFPTICHNIDESSASMKLYYYKNNKFFYCFTECGGMSIFKFLTHYYKSHNIEYDWYLDVFKVAESCSIETSNFQVNTNLISLRDKSTHKAEVVLPEYSANVLSSFSHYYPPEWLKDGISEKTIDKYNILYSINKNKIIIPHYDINNRLVGIRGRALNKWEVENIGKYQPVMVEGTIYNHPLSLNLYGLNFNIDNIRKSGTVYIFEAEKSILQLDSFSIPNCGVAVCGSNFNKFQLNILLRHCYPKEIILCFDNEEKEKEEKYFLKLYNICKKYEIYCNFSFIYDRERLLKMKDSPSDRGEDVFLKLLDRRVKIR